MAVARSATDAIRGLARELFLFAALLAAASGQFAARGIKNPVVNAVIDHLKHFSFGHALYTSTNCFRRVADYPTTTRQNRCRV